MPPSTRAGRWIRQQRGPEGFTAFVPAPLPPKPPPAFPPELQHLSERAGRALGRLEGISASLEPDRLLYMYLRKEAVLSSGRQRDRLYTYSKQLEILDRGTSG